MKIITLRYYVAGPVYMLPALRGPAVCRTSYYLGCPFNRWLLCPGLYLYGPGPFVWVFAYRFAGLYFVYYASYLLFLGGGGLLTDGGVGRSRFPVFIGFLGWSP